MLSMIRNKGGSGVKMRKPEKKCPNCGSKRINWKVVRDGLGNPFYNGLCLACNAVMKGREPPEVTRGRNLERGELKDVSCMSKRITSLSCDTQIGILRERQKHLFTKSGRIK